MKFFVFVLCLFFINVCVSQTHKDVVLTNKIHNLLIEANKSDYFRAKSLLKDLETKHGYLPKYTKRLLQQSLKYDDTLFFKKEFIHLVREYGLNFNHLQENALYKTLTKGALSDWFWEEYPENRMIWLKKNYEKLAAINKLNALYVKDQHLANFYSSTKKKMAEKPENKVLEQIIDSLFLKKTLNHFDQFMQLIQTIGYYPSSKNFALPETPYFLVTTHALKTPSVSMKCLKQIYPYWEKAYLTGQIDYLVFGNFDIQLLMSIGKQYFGTVQYEEIPSSFLKHLNLKNKKIPVLDPEGLKERRKKLGWK